MEWNFSLLAHIKWFQFPSYLKIDKTSIIFVLYFFKYSDNFLNWNLIYTLIFVIIS